jgi:hypothetical protein
MPIFQRLGGGAGATDDIRRLLAVQLRSSGSAFVTSTFRSSSVTEPSSLVKEPCRFAVETTKCPISAQPCGWQTWRRLTLPRLKTQYHQRWGFSRPSSGWDRVQAPRSGHQVGQPQGGPMISRLDTETAAPWTRRTSSLKGGDPAAGSPTATLLRLHPSR